MTTQRPAVSQAKTLSSVTPSCWRRWTTATDASRTAASTSSATSSARWARRRSASDRRRGHRRPRHGRPARAGQYPSPLLPDAHPRRAGGPERPALRLARPLYPIWAGLTPEAIAVSTKIAIAELLLSGCTTTSDHLPVAERARIDDQIEAALAMGIRFHAARGSMSVGASQGGLPPDHVVEDETAILRDCRRVIEAYHDASRYAMLDRPALLALLRLPAADARQHRAGP